jgi:hypothetical protein
MFNQYIAYRKKILTTPESEAMFNRLRKINSYIRDARTSKLHNWVHNIQVCDTLPNIFLHIHTILVEFINKKLYVNSEEYFYLMKCGNYILNAKYITNSKIGQYKYMVALYFLNYIKQLTTHEFRDKYVCNINEYIKTCYNDVLVESTLQSTAEMRCIYMNLKKIIYVKKWNHSINSKVFCIMLEYLEDNNYIATEIPASYIAKDALLTDTELLMLDVTQKDMDLLFGVCNHATNDVVIQENDEIDDTVVISESEMGDLSIKETTQNNEAESQEEPEDVIYPDEYE